MSDLDTQTASRSCGACTVCCTALAIETKALRKPPGITCRHCTQAGCSIHETRFPICRTYFCGWHTLPELDEDWRPDLSGVLISPQNANIPVGYEFREGIEFLVLGGEEAVRRSAFTSFVIVLLRSRTPTFLAVRGPAGYYPARVFLNDALAHLTGDPGAVAEILVRMIRSAAGHRFEPMPPPNRNEP